MKEYLMNNKLILSVTVTVNIISSVLAVFLAKLLQKIIDIAIYGNIYAFKKTLIYAISYIIVLGLISYLYSLCSKLLIKNFTRMMRKRVFNGIFQKNFYDYSIVNTADYISVFTNDIKMVEENYIIPLLMVLQYGVMFIVTIILLFSISPLIAVCLIGCMILMLVIPGLMGKSLQARQEMLSIQLSFFTSRLKDFFSGYEVIKSFQITNHVKEKFDSENDNLSNTKYRADKLMALNEGISGILAYITQFAGLFIGAFLINKGDITAGKLVALIQLSGTFVGPVMIILQNIPKVTSMKPIIKRMNEFSDYTDASFMGTLNPSFTDKIAVENLSFAYEDNHHILVNTNLVLKKGKKYVIVGKSGCGKTTLVKLLTGYYSSYTGEITYDGINLCDLNIERLQNMVSVIHQNIFMFDDSIKQNICLADTFEEKDWDDALITSGVGQFLKDMPDGLLSKVGENGSNLSGGQRQRVAVARALIRHKPFLVLDEGTSAIDMQTAYDIESRLLKIKDLTLITITHNLSADILKQYDQIIYMENGVVTDIGSLTELMSRQGGFYNFANLQK